MEIHQFQMISKRNFTMYFNKKSKKRHTKIQNQQIKSGDEIFTIQRKQSTLVTDLGDIETEETVQSVMVGDIKVDSISKIFGKCHDCGLLVTYLNKRICFCGKIVCTNCCEWWDEDNRPVCSNCYKVLKKKKFWSSFWHLILSPFIERREN